MKFCIFVATFFVAGSRCVLCAPYESGGYVNTGHSAQYRHDDGYGNYEFGYNEDHATGGTFRKEKGGPGYQVGSYGLRDADGRMRIVHYIADEHGFRATITTNEPGVDVKQDPASTSLSHSAYDPIASPVLESASHPIRHLKNMYAAEPIPHAAEPEPMPESLPEPLPESLSEPLPESMSEPAPIVPTFREIEFPARRPLTRYHDASSSIDSIEPLYGHSTAPLAIATAVSPFQQKQLSPSHSPLGVYVVEGALNDAMMSKAYNDIDSMPYINSNHYDTHPHMAAAASTITPTKIAQRSKYYDEDDYADDSDDHYATMALLAAPEYGRRLSLPSSATNLNYGKNAADLAVAATSSIPAKITPNNRFNKNVYNAY